MKRKVRKPSLTFSPDPKEFAEKLPQMVRQLEAQLKGDPELAEYIIEEFNASSDLKIARNGHSTKDWFKNAVNNEIVPLAYIAEKSIIPDAGTGEETHVEDIINSRWLFSVFANVFPLCQFQHIEEGRDQNYQVATSLSESILGMDATTQPQMMFGLGDIQGQGEYKEGKEYTEYTLVFNYEKAAFQFTTKVLPAPEFNLTFVALIPNYPYKELIKTGIWCALLQVNAVHGCLDSSTATDLLESIRKLNSKKPAFAWNKNGFDLKAETLKFQAPTGEGVGFKISTTSDTFSSEVELLTVKHTDDSGFPPSFQLTHTCRLL